MRNPRRIERGTYTEVASMHQTAINNNWIVLFCLDENGYFLILIGKTKRLV
jgi:hypothetical protein